MVAGDGHLIGVLHEDRIAKHGFAFEGGGGSCWCEQRIQTVIALRVKSLFEVSADHGANFECFLIIIGSVFSS